MAFQLAVFFLLILFFSWSLFLMISDRKRKVLSLESPLFLLMVVPELVLAVVLVFLSLEEAVLGLVIGVSLINFLLIPGLVAIFQGQTKIVIKNLRLDFLVVFLTVAFPLIMLGDFRLSWWEGVALLVLAGGLFSWRWWSTRATNQALSRHRGDRLLNRPMVFLSLCLAPIFFLLSVLVLLCLPINWSLLVLGLIPLALIVSLPEILVNLQLAKNQPTVSFDGLLTPLVFNVTFILGLTAVLSPIVIAGLGVYLRSVLLFLFGFAIFYFFAWSKKRINRLEGIILVIYFFLSLLLIAI